MPEDGYVFRQEFALLKPQLSNPVQDAHCKVAILAMTATMTKDLKNDFENMMGVGSYQAVSFGRHFSSRGFDDDTLLSSKANIKKERSGT